MEDGLICKERRMKKSYMSVSNQIYHERHVPLTSTPITALMETKIISAVCSCRWLIM